jgi:hypothetical protein
VSAPKLTLELIEGWRAHVANGDYLSPEATLALLDSARALARLEAWLTEGRVFSFERRGTIHGVFAERGRWICDARKAPDLAAAIHKALDGAEVRE